MSGLMRPRRAARADLSERRGVTVTLAAVAGLVFLALPVLLVVPMSLTASGDLGFPPQGLSLRWYAAIFESSAWREAFVTSLWLGGVVSLISTVVGGVGAYALVRSGSRWSRVLMLNSLAPLVMPQIVTAVALYIGFARVGLLGSPVGLVVAHVVLALPYVLLVMSVAVGSLDIRIEQAAQSLGASRLTAIRTIVVPLLRPSVAAAALFAFVISFDEAVITLFVAGSRDTVPKRIFTEIMVKLDPTIAAVSSLLIFASVALLVLSTFLMRLQRRVRD